jgi:hypothetical protein
MTKIIYGSDSIEVEPSCDRPNRGILETLSFIEARQDNPGISNKNARRIAGLAADLILRDLANNDNNFIIGE